MIIDLPLKFVTYPKVLISDGLNRLRLFLIFLVFFPPVKDVPYASRVTVQHKEKR
jgi:hypothetical protein